MNLFFRGSFALLSLGAVSFAAAQSPGVEKLIQPNVTGSATLNGTAYSGEVMRGGDILSLLADGGTTTSSGTFAAPPQTGGEGRRSMLKFSAHGTGGFLLPSDRYGNMAAANDGDTFISNTWNPETYPQTGGNHSFGASVSVNNPGDTANIDLEVKDSPDTTFARTGGSYAVSLLDNSIYDQDSTVGSVLINKDLTPTITLTYEIPEYSFTRDVVTWADGSTSASLFSDRNYSNMWFILSNSTNSSIFDSDSDLNGSPTLSERVDWVVGEGLDTKVVHSYSGSFTFSTAGIANGLYTAGYWSIPWHTAGYDDQIGFGSGGFVESSFTESSFEVVPEPASMAALALGVIGLARRRRK